MLFSTPELPGRSAARGVDRGGRARRRLVAGPRAGRPRGLLGLRRPRHPAHRARHRRHRHRAGGASQAEPGRAVRGRPRALSRGRRSDRARAGRALPHAHARRRPPRAGDAHRGVLQQARRTRGPTTARIAASSSWAATTCSRACSSWPAASIRCGCDERGPSRPAALRPSHRRPLAGAGLWRDHGPHHHLHALRTQRRDPPLRPSLVRARCRTHRPPPPGTLTGDRVGPVRARSGDPLP